jgi:hypothetical protein
MPSKNKNIIRRSKTRKQQHRSRKHKRNNNNNNARNQTIRGGFRWPWRKPTPSLMTTLNSNPNFLRKTPQRTSPTLMETLKSNPNFLKKTPQRTSPSSPPQRPSQPRLPTNVGAVTDALREGVSKKNRDFINDLTKHKEPLIKQRDELVVNKDLLERSKKQEKDLKNRTLIREKIAKIKTEIRLIETEIRATSREIERTQKQDVKYREDRGLPGLPPDTGDMDAPTEMAKVDEAAGVYGAHLGNQAVVAELKLREQSKVADTNQDELSNAMKGMSLHRGSTLPRDSVENQRQIDKVVDEVTREVSGSRRGSSRSGSSARSSTPRRGSSARGSSARGSSARSPSP